MPKLRLAAIAILLTGTSLSAQDSAPLSARDYYNEIKSTNTLNQYMDTFVCFGDDDAPSFAVISRGTDIIDEMKNAGATPNKTVLQAKDLLFVQTYYKGVANQVEAYEPVGKDGTDWDIEFGAPIHGRMLYSFNWATGRYRLSVFALDRSKTVPATESDGKCELIHPQSNGASDSPPSVRPPAHLIDADGGPVAGAPEPEVVQLENVETIDGMLHVTVGNVAGDYVLVCNLQANKPSAVSCAAPQPSSNYLLFRRDTKWLITGAKQPIDLHFMTDWEVSYNDKENIGLLPAKKNDEQFHVFWLSSWTAKSAAR